MSGADTAELSALAIRGAALFLPLLPLIALCVLRPPGRRETAAMIVATAWSLLAIIPLNLVAVRVGWWSFHADGAEWRGIPVDLLLAWAVLWGALPALALRYLPVPLLVVVLVWFDTLFMPLAEPVVVLGPWWVLGELAGTAVGLIPALLLAHWTLRGTLVHARMWAQAFLALGFMVVLPVAVAAPEVVGIPAPAWSVGAQALSLAALPGLAAAREFSAVGNGTPLPHDPPAQLVTSGPYAYIRNPMQATVVCIYLVLGVLHPVLWIGAVVAFAYGAGLAAWHEGGQLRAAFGGRWEHYRRGVRPWVPRWRPWPGRTEGTLYAASDCSVCLEVRAWVETRRPVRLRVRQAADHPEVLYRLTYEDTFGNRWSGVAALARALEHLNLAWALAGRCLWCGTACSCARTPSAPCGGPRARDSAVERRFYIKARIQVRAHQHRRERGAATSAPGFRRALHVGHERRRMPDVESPRGRVSRVGRRVHEAARLMCPAAARRAGWRPHRGPRLCSGGPPGAGRPRNERQRRIRPPVRGPTWKTRRC